jgi:hypothetical protein
MLRNLLTFNSYKNHEHSLKSTFFALERLKFDFTGLKSSGIIEKRNLIPFTYN